MRFISVLELLGARHDFPFADGYPPWLTPLAAVGMALIQVLAIFTEHLPKKEYKVLPMNVVLLALSLLVIFGRWVIFTAGK